MVGQSYYQYDSPIGKLCFSDNGRALTRLFVVKKEETFEYQLGYGSQASYRETSLIKGAHQQLEDYLAGQRTDFQVPLEPVGSVFQKKVWQALTAIPYGQTRTYREVAEAVGQPTAARAVGGANHRNPILILIPCHRVIGANGQLVGFAAGLDIKKRLLAIEADN